ncbi:MAG: nicotinate (nicotinamide) nucleotide adenylyltransferase [Gemmatimonas sp.]|jgi:nicotinate-nucleotide adenylyltransferase|uniref:nicotinate (nicotinamide) nucleotide adenylyltransferase n=1 Tax=Gemmatimonas sp. TaxID=1962908 RepID=UPI00391F88FF|nr:nicotinate (nicotinamide) nucleotide adenylyltransferase [Gemmatimonadota bacterium]
MRLGLLGGSFDPPHVGHLLMAQDALDVLSLDRLVIVPAARQPLKSEDQTPAAHRLAMVQAGFAGVPGIEVDPVEIARGGLSYMVDTVEEMQRRWPGTLLHLLIGGDVVPTLPRWKDVDRLLRMVQLVVLSREVADASPGPDVVVHGGVVAQRLATRRVDVSSTEIRARVRSGRSIRGFVPDAVATYIASTGLYREKSRVTESAESRSGA